MGHNPEEPRGVRRQANAVELLAVAPQPACRVPSRRQRRQVHDLVGVVRHERLEESLCGLLALLHIEGRPDLQLGAKAAQLL
eukprot:3465702-Lingulodinium_polyedra.AAC.1